MEQHKENLLTIPAAIIIAGIIIAGAVIYIKRPPQPPQASDNAKAAVININPISDKDHIRGNADAPVTIVEFSDFECPFCKMFDSTMQRIMNEYGKAGKVAWVYRHFPLDQIHPKARKEAEASECAWDQGGNDAFWKYADKIFATTPSNNRLDPALLPQFAKDIGLDVAKFNSCLSKGIFVSKIEADYQDGLRVGIGTIPGSGTPYSVIIDKKGNKIPVSGAQPYEVIKQIIDAVLADNK